MSHQGLNKGYYMQNLQARGTQNGTLYEAPQQSFYTPRIDGEQVTEQKQWLSPSFTVSPSQCNIASLLQSTVRPNYSLNAAAASNTSCQVKLDDIKGRKRKLSGQPLDLTVSNQSDVIDLSSKRQATGNEFIYPVAVRATEPPIPKDMHKPPISPMEHRSNIPLDKGMESLFHLVVDQATLGSQSVADDYLLNVIQSSTDYREDQSPSLPFKIVNSESFSNVQHRSLLECASVTLKHLQLTKILAIRYHSKWYCWLNLVAAALNLEYESLQKSLCSLGQTNLMTPSPIHQKMLQHYLTNHKPPYLSPHLRHGHLIALQSIDCERVSKFLQSFSERGSLVRQQRSMPMQIPVKNQPMVSKTSAAITRPILPKCSSTSATITSTPSPPPTQTKLQQVKEVDEGPKQQTLTFRDRTFYYVKRGASKFISKQHLYEKLFKANNNYHKFSKAVKSAGFVLRNSSKQEEELLKEPYDDLQSHRLLLLSDLEKNFDKLLSSC